MAQIYLNDQNCYAPDMIAHTIMDIIQATKKVSRDLEGKEVSYLIDVVTSINNLDQYARSFSGIRLEDIKIPKFLQDFIFPKKVAIGPDSRYPDLVWRPKEYEGADYDEMEVRKSADRIYGLFKQEAEYVNLTDIRSEKYLLDIRYCVSNGHSILTYSNNDTFVLPTPVDSDVIGVTGLEYLNEDANYIVGKYFNMFRIV